MDQKLFIYFLLMTTPKTQVAKASPKRPHSENCVVVQSLFFVWQPFFKRILNWQLSSKAMTSSGSSQNRHSSHKKIQQFTAIDPLLARHTRWMIRAHLKLLKHALSLHYAHNRVIYKNVQWNCPPVWRIQDFFWWWRQVKWVNRP